jgi:hypothetical protein
MVAMMAHQHWWDRFVDEQAVTTDAGLLYLMLVAASLIALWNFGLRHRGSFKRLFCIATGALFCTAVIAWSRWPDVFAVGEYRKVRVTEVYVYLGFGLTVFLATVGAAWVVEMARRKGSRQGARVVR